MEGFPDIYEPETVEAIVRLTRCQPYLVQLVCYEVVERLNAENRRTATPDDVAAVVPVAFERGDEYFRELWRATAPAERDVLVRLARGQPPSAAPAEVLRALVRREILEPDDGGYRFQVPLIRRWVAEQRGTYSEATIE